VGPPHPHTDAFQHFQTGAGYPLSEAGQRKWLADLVAFCRGQQQIRGLFYWSPEWYSEEMWKAFALFDTDGNAKEALSAFRDEKRK
jgi:arabinogalactan endo-1,4-beta-galactosidase